MVGTADTDLFIDTSVRKIQVYLVTNGTLISSVSIPNNITGYVSSALDPIAVQVIDSGIRVSYMVNGVGILTEFLEYRNNIGVRTHINAFNTCTNTGSIFSNGKDIIVQDAQILQVV